MGTYNDVVMPAASGIFGNSTQTRYGQVTVHAGRANRPKGYTNRTQLKGTAEQIADDYRHDFDEYIHTSGNVG